MAKTSVDPRVLAMQALSKAIADPAARPLHGTKAKPGIFDSSTPDAKKAAELCLSSGWISEAGESAVGKKRVALYRITPQGVREAIESNETLVLLRDMLASLADKQSNLSACRQQLDDLHGVIEQQGVVLQEMVEKVRPANVAAAGHQEPADRPAGGAGTPATGAPRAASSTAGWADAAVAYVRDFRRRNPHLDCPLTELFHQTAKARGLSIGQFHDGLRELLRQRIIELHPYTGSDYALKEGELALIVGTEIKYYATIA